MKLTVEQIKEKYGSQEVKSLFTEYLMELTAKADLLDKVSEAVENGVGIKEIREILYGTNHNNSDQTGIIS